MTLIINFGLDYKLVTSSMNFINNYKNSMQNVLESNFREVMTIAINAVASRFNRMWVENGKLQSHLKWPYTYTCKFICYDNYVGIMLIIIIKILPGRI